MMCNLSRRNGFTLIELLIVVAIIGILAAIAVPNFLNAQLRAKISRTYSDLRAISVAMESYQVDRNAFPPNNSHLTVHLTYLTTPVAYIASIDFRDIFKAEQGNTGNNMQSYLYFLYKYVPGYSWMAAINRADLSTDGFCLSSWGPDRAQGGFVGGRQTAAPIEWYYVLSQDGKMEQARNTAYIASNGLVSGGDIGRWGGSVSGVPTLAGG